MNLRVLNYEEARGLLIGKSDEELVDVLAGKSRKLGDTAFELLRQRDRFDLVIRALAERRITRRDGKVRALNMLLGEGRRLPEAYPIYMQYAADSCSDAVSSALFGLAFWQDASAIPHLEKLLPGKHADMIEKAIAALRVGDPKKYSPYFFDSQHVWRSP